jgi:hypothetical protein
VIVSGNHGTVLIEVIDSELEHLQMWWVVVQCDCQ